MSVDATVLRGSLRLATITVAATAWAASSGAADAEDLARVKHAIAYLDARQEEWSRFTKSARGEGADKTVCVSCHTGISYALARPAMGRFAAASAPSAPEERMTRDVVLRVEHWTELDSPRFRLMYDHDARKKVESRGTEAVLNALVLSRGRGASRTPAQTAFRHLWATQTTEGSDAGSWEWLNFGLEPWEARGSRAFGAALAAIAVGSAHEPLNGQLDEQASRGVGLLRDYLRRRFPEESVYNRLWILEASTTFEGLLSNDQKHEVVDQLLAEQRDDGGWALADLGGFTRVDGTAQVQASDGYATGLVLHALLRAGLPSVRPELARGLGWVRSRQQADGSWPGRSVNKEREPGTFAAKLMSDAATAFAAQALVEAARR